MGVFFLSKCWDVISYEVSNAITYMFSTLDLPQGTNSSLVALNQKVVNSIRVTDFKPVVMGNFIYKVYTKIIASRLGSFIGDILSPTQFGFIPGRRIHTCIALASWDGMAVWL